nr:hypothetical protein [uncultured Flavobacterium sp.]
MTKIKVFKNILIVFTTIIFLIIIWISFDLINETSPKQIEIDFVNKSDIISGYGTLIGGVLSFLSILFVILSLLEQRQQILRNEELVENENKKELLDKLKLLNTFLKSMIDGIIEQGTVMQKYYLEEQTQPSKMNRMYFLVNRNFARAVEMDSLSIYNGIKFYLKDDPDWEKTFLNLFTLIDFYKEGIEELKAKYTSQIKYKVEEQRKIGSAFFKLMNMCASMIDDYKIANPDNYMSFPWAKLVNQFTGEYYGYLQECEDNDEATDFRVISNDILIEFLRVSMEFRNTIGYDIFGSRNIVSFIADLRKQINEIEVHCKYYAKDIEEQYDSYFSPENDSLDKLKKIKIKIETIVT